MSVALHKRIDPSPAPAATDRMVMVLRVSTTGKRAATQHKQRLRASFGNIAAADGGRYALRDHQIFGRHSHSPRAAGGAHQPDRRRRIPPIHSGVTPGEATRLAPTASATAAAKRRSVCRGAHQAVKRQQLILRCTHSIFLPLSTTATQAKKASVSSRGLLLSRRRERRPIIALHRDQISIKSRVNVDDVNRYRPSGVAQPL